MPTYPPVTQRKLVAASAEALQAPPAKVSTMPHGLMRVIGRVNPMMRELMAVAYQFFGPWVIDSSATTQTLGIEPTNWEDIVYQSAHGNP